MMARSGTELGPRAAAVLVVEDDAAVREVLIAALEAAGMRAEGAGSCDEALRLASRLRPDVVVIDRQLPDGDGWRLVDELRRRAGPHEAIVIAITAHVGLSTAERALVAGCEAFFEKPFDPSVVIERAKRLLAARAPTTTVRRKKLT